MKDTLLLLVPIATEHKALLLERFRVIEAPDAASRAAAIAAHAADIELVLTNGTVGFTAAEIAALPNLTLLAAQGAGYENLDLGTVLTHHRPTAIIASNDLLALGVIAALRRERLSVPDDVSVAGFDGIALGRLMSPTLTTIAMPDGDMGLAAAALLPDMAESASDCRHLTLECRLYAGGTVHRLG